MPSEIFANRRQRPVVGGISCSHKFVSSGTLGCLCRERGTRSSGSVFALSNAHVFAPSGRSAPGDSIYQPAPQQNGTSIDAIAELHRSAAVNEAPAAANQVDAAIARLLPDVEYRTEVHHIGVIAGCGDAAIGMRVCKFGRSTGYTEGVVTALDATHDVHVSPSKISRTARYIDQICIEPAESHSYFATEGDSGSVVVDMASRKVVGLFFAAAQSYEYALANPIALVCEELEIELL